MVGQLNKANSSDTETPFLNLNLSITNGMVLYLYSFSQQYPVLSSDTILCVLMLCKGIIRTFTEGRRSNNCLPLATASHLFCHFILQDSWTSVFISSALNGLVTSAKYLGITITDNMNWGLHVSEISSKATKTLGFLRGNMAYAPRSTKEVAYKILVWPKLEYAAPIWSPHLKLQINQFEKVQRTAARWTCRGDGETRVVSAKCLMSLNGHLLRPGWTSPPCFSFTRFIVEQCLLKKTTSKWPLLTVWKLAGHLIVLNTADTRHTVMPWRIPFSPELFHIGIVCLLLWPLPSPQRSLGHSLFKQKFSQKFLWFFLLFFFCFFFVFHFIKISKFALPGVMLKFERNQ